MRLNRIVFPSLLLFVAAAACGDDDTGSSGTPGACEPTAASVTAIFAASCNTAGCHNASDAAAGLDLESAGVEGRLIDQAANTCNRTLVVPGDPVLSFLNEKLTSAMPECGAQMPVGSTLGPAELGCVSDWIASLTGGCETCGGSGCADLEADTNNCGACGNVCPAGATCSAGVCACGSTEMACGDACVDVTSDPNNCGSCGRTCPPVLVCSLSDCKMGCDGGLTQCGNACVDTDNDPNNCGGCEADCGTGSCSNGACDCGAGVDPQTDPNNCGSCGNVCPPGQTCEAGACACGTASVSFSSTIQPILTANCATIGCHRPPMAKEGLDLTSGTAYGQLVNVAASQCSNRMRVLPGDPANSYMVNKILGVELCFGSKMPKMGTVPTADVEAISDWICGGAQNN